MSSTAHDKQAKNHSASPASKTAESTQKAAHSGMGSTRTPAWTNVWGDNPPVRLINPVADLQAKRMLSQPGDPYEQEADRVADQVIQLAATGSPPIALPPDSPARSLSLTASVSHVSPMIQRAPVEGESAPTPATDAAAPEAAPTSDGATAGSAPEDVAPSQTPTPGLIVEDTVDQPGPGQMKKSDFLAQLRDAVCTTTEEALKGTIWSAAGCPWVDYWFGYYSNRDSQQIERALRRYAPETANATSAGDYIPIICERVRSAIAVWSSTGEVTGVPEGVSANLPGAASPESSEETASTMSSENASAAPAEGEASPATNAVMFKQRQGGANTANNPAAIRTQLGSGHSLDGGVKSHMESAFGMDFSHVRVHTDTRAVGLSNSLNARAFTVGEHVAFGAGEYQPGTLVGDALIAHELAHVVQQRGTDSFDMPQQKGGTSYNALEEDADVSAVGAMVSIWGGAKTALSSIARNAMPRLQSGLKLQRCSSVPNPYGVHRDKLNAFDKYRDQFNSLWDVSPYSGMPPSFDPALSSKGPRNTRARAIFEKIYTTDPVLKAAYDANTDGIRERIDSYTGPEGLNLIGSPRLETLRTAFASYSAPVSSAEYPAFKGSVQTAANALDDKDRRAVASSNAWEQVINEYVTTDTQRQEIHAIIAKPPAAPVPAAPPTPPSPTPPAAPAPAPKPSKKVTPQQFVNSIRIQGPTAPVPGNNREEPVTLTPHSTIANPGVGISTRFTVTPGDHVKDSNVSPDSPWPNTATGGVPFDPKIIINTPTVAMNAHLDLVNGPAGLAPSPPTPDLPFTVNDNRQANFVAHWDAQITYNDEARQVVWASGATVRYINGKQNFQVGAVLPSPLTNPGLTLFVRAQILRGAAVAFAPPALELFPPDQDHIPLIAMALAAPPVVPAGGDPLTFRVELLDIYRTTVLDTKYKSISVLPEFTYTQAQAQTQATVDNAHFQDTSPTGLLGIMTARGGIAANVADAIKVGKISLAPLTIRHDSAAYVARKAPDPTKSGYFVGTSYLLAGPDPNSLELDAGASGFSLSLGHIVVNRTIDVSVGSKRPDDEIIIYVIHEAVHAMDIRPDSETTLERYKTEFRAYWMDGRYGPPDTAICPAPSSTCYNATFDPTMTPPGPKSPRARAIFERELYGHDLYSYVKPAYDKNTDGFREAVDNYLVPDGINLIVSMRLEALRDLISKGVGTFEWYTTFRAKVQAFMGVGAPPPGGVLTTDERNEIIRNRAWRDLVESSISNSDRQKEIKGDLGIPL